MTMERQHFKYTEEYMETFLNHEWLHLVVAKLVGKKTSRRLDRIYIRNKNPIVMGDGSPNF